MARNRVIYQSEALYVGDDLDAVGSGSIRQLSRVQSANMSYDLAGSRTDVNQFGQLARIDSVITDTPSVTMDFTYYLTDGWNEKSLGFAVRKQGDTSDVQFASGSLRGGSGQNFWVLTTPEGEDANTYADTDFIGLASGYSAMNTAGAAITTKDFQYIGVGNAFLSDYTIDAAVGDFPTVSVSVEGLNANAGNSAYSASGFGIDTEAPYDINGDLPTEAGGQTLAEVQSQTADAENGIGIYGIYGVESPGITATDGTKRTVSLSNGSLFDGVILPKPVQAIAGDLEYEHDSETTVLRPGDITMNLDNFTTTTGRPFSQISGNDGVCIQNFSLSLPLSRTPLECLGTKFAKARVVDFPVTATLTVSATMNELVSGNLVDVLNDTENEKQITITIKDPADSTTDRIKLDVKKAIFDAESWSSSIGPNKTVDLTFSTQIAGANTSDAGIFMSGSWDKA